MKEIKWAVLGCGVIANEMAVALQKNGKNIYAVGNRTHEKAAAFAEKYGIGKVYDDFHEMFTDPEVDVIYITTPHNTHLGFMKEAIANGKHILVEKSITLNSDELDEAIALAKEKDVIIGEAMTIYHMPIYKELKKILDSGRLGRVNLITMNFGSFKEYNMKNRFFNRNLAGGAMLDIGVYALSFLRWFFDSKPDQLLSQVKPAPTGVDEQAGLLLTNQEGQMASVMLSLHSKQPKRGMVTTMDVGHPVFIHPVDKETVGNRLAYWALAQTYGMKGFGYAPPVYKSMEIQENKIYINFYNAQRGLSPMWTSLKGFEIAGEDKVFYPAFAEIETTTARLAVSSDKVSHPVAVRYAYKNYVEASIFSIHGIPAAPFRTDNW